MRTIEDLIGEDPQASSLAGKRVFVRVDFNVPQDLSLIHIS